jgi:hypothetical protein
LLKMSPLKDPCFLLGGRLYRPFIDPTVCITTKEM